MIEEPVFVERSASFCVDRSANADDGHRKKMSRLANAKRLSSREPAAGCSLLVPPRARVLGGSSPEISFRLRP